MYSTHQARKGQLADEQVGGLLVLADLADGVGARTEPPLLAVSRRRTPLRAPRASAAPDGGPAACRGA